MKRGIFKLSSSKIKTDKQKSKLFMTKNRTRRGAKSNLKSRLMSRVSIVAVLSVVAAAGLLVPAVRADQFDAQIRELQGDNAEAMGARDALQDQATATRTLSLSSSHR
jgi:hypothetical protein